MTHKLKPADTDRPLWVATADGQVVEIRTVADASPSSLSPGGCGFVSSMLVPESGMSVFPWGADNMLPLHIFNLLRQDNIAEPIVGRTVGLFWGRGPEVDYGGIPADALERVKSFVQRIRLPRLLLGLAVDYFHTRVDSFYVQTSQNGRELAAITYLPAWQVRLAKREDNPHLTPTHAIVGDYSGSPTTLDTRVYPLFDPSDPLAHPISVCVAREQSFFANPYPNPEFSGGEQWMRRSIETPVILSSFINNSMSLRWIVRIPVNYWTDMKERIEAQMREKNSSVSQQQIEDEYAAQKKEKLDNFTGMLSGATNVGKAYISDISYEVMGEKFLTHKWEVEQVDLKISDYIGTILKISEAADAKKTGAFSLHASMANVGQTGRSDSGSEQLYAYTNHLNSSVAIPQMTICSPVEEILRIVAGIDPGDDRLRITFDRPQPARESDLSASRRLTGQTVPD